MPSRKEIKNHIKSIRDTRKIANAMYLISSTKLRKAKAELDNTRPYFNALRTEIKRIFRTAPDIENRYFYPSQDSDKKLDGTYCCLVITADRGLAGSYSHNVLKSAVDMLASHPDTKLFVVGEYGRQYFIHRGIPIERSFLYPAQNPTMQRAREISSILLDKYDRGEFEKIYIIYTDMKNGQSQKPIETRLLPFHRSHFDMVTTEDGTPIHFEFVPSTSVVLDNVIQSYITGFIYSALVDSFCCEQNARMAAMSSAVENADKMLDRLSVEYNRMRQSLITQEITEVAAGARAQNNRREVFES